MLFSFTRLRGNLNGVPRFTRLEVSCAGGKKSTPGGEGVTRICADFWDEVCPVFIYERNCDPASQERDAFSRPLLFFFLWLAHMWK